MVESTTRKEQPQQEQQHKQEEEKEQAQVKTSLAATSFEIDEDSDAEQAALLSDSKSGGSSGNNDNGNDNVLSLQRAYQHVVKEAVQSRTLLLYLSVFLALTILVGVLASSSSSSHGDGHDNTDQDVAKTLPVAPSAVQDPAPTVRPGAPKQPTLPPKQIEQNHDGTTDDSDDNHDGTEGNHGVVVDDDSNKIKYYCDAKTDRAGSQILDMLMMDSFIFHKGGVFGGACAKFETAKEQDKFDKHLEDKMRLIRLLGMENVFKFACPTHQELASGQAIMLDRHDYHHFDKTFSMEWVRHVRAKSTFEYTERSAGAPRQIAVHMRRGDYSPCRAGHGQKYLPNAYYLNVLDEYLPQYCRPDMKACNLTIFSEERAFEDFKPFQKRNYHIDYDSSLEQIWTAFINADLLVLSRSSFSWVPGIMNQHHVVTPQYKYPVCDNWDVASDEICRISDNITETFVNHDCRRRWWQRFFL